jgi:tRNA-binding protein
MTTDRTLTYQQFTAVDVRVGTVTRAEVFAEARKPAYKMWVDFGPEVGTLKSSAQLTHHYMPEQLVGRQVVAVVNFPPKQIGPVKSECLILGVPDPDGEPVLLGPSTAVPNGGRLF